MPSAGPSLWTSSQAAAATGGIASAPFIATGVSIDSRAIERGDLFVALRSARDGHEFAADAMSAGAIAAMVARDLPGLSPLLKVADTQIALERLGAARRAAVDAKIIAVTGSVGKTGTKEALRHVLSRQGKTHASAASYNNLWGVPLSLARMPEDTRFGVFEIGMNHAGEIRPLTRQVRPDVAIVTTVEPVHLEFFRDTEEIAAAKAEIFEGLSGGTAVLNRDNPHFAQLASAARAHGAARIISFGAQSQADIRLEKFEAENDSSRVDADVLGRRIIFAIGQPGRHIAMNCLAVLAAVEAIGADVNQAADSLGSLTPVAGRGTKIEIAWNDGAVTLIDESYNASPASIRAALAVLETHKTGSAGRAGRRIAILGDMRELGRRSEELHRGLAAEVIKGADLLFACGPHMRALYDALPPERQGAYAVDSDGLAPLVVANLRGGDVAMVKGSLGSRMKRVVDAIRAAGGA